MWWRNEWLLVLALFGVPLSICQGNDVDRELLNRFRRASADMRKAVNRLSFDARCERTEEVLAPSDEAVAEVQKHNVPIGKPELKLSMRIAVNRTMRLKEEISKGGEQQFFVKNDAYAFYLHRSQPVKKYAIEFLEQLDTGGSYDARIEELEANNVNAIVLAGYCFLYIPLADLVESPAFQVKHVGIVQVDGEELVRIEFDHLTDDPQRKRNRYSDAWMHCDPARGWILRECGTTLFHGGVIERKIAFGEVNGGIPIPKTITALYTAPKISKAAKRIVISVNVLQQDIPDAEFYLPHYGFPKPRFQRPWFAMWFWYAVVGIAFCVIAIGLKKYYRRT